MELNNRESVWAECQELGEAAVRARLANGSFGTLGILPNEWLLEQEEKRRATKEAANSERNERTLAASEASARSSEKAAEASLRSARWTMWAAIAAFLSVVVSGVAQCMSTK